MSHYTEVKTKLRNAKYLVEALTSLGVRLSDITQSSTKQTLRGYGSQTRQANVIVKKGSLSRWGEVGWELMEDGTYQMHVDNMDNNLINGKWAGQLQVKYGEAAVKDIASQYGFYVEENKQVGEELHITCTRY